MGSTFNPQILVEKLAKLNSSQQSIETLSHWCIFHMNKARQVVETWARQFHSSPREQRLAFLYLANDILQNSRRKGSEFVAEFWKVLPDALHDVIKHGDELGKNSAMRLITIWDDRKVFGSRCQILKEEFVKRQMDSSNRNGKHTGFKLKPDAGNVLDKIASGYQNVYGTHLDEDAIFNKCRNAVSSVEKVHKEIGGDVRSGHINGSSILDELKGQYEVLGDCIEQLTAVESSRANLVSLLREALQEQEYKLERVRNQLQAAQSHSEQASEICGQLNRKSNVLAEQGQKEIHVSSAPQNSVSGNGEQTAPVMYTKQVPLVGKSNNVEEDHKSAAAAMAAKLTASTSSAQMLSYVLSSLASESVISNPSKESSSDYPNEKRAKLENDNPCYIHHQNLQAAAPHFTHNLPAAPQESGLNEQPPPPSSPPPLPPLPPTPPYAVAPYMQTAPLMPSGPYGYGLTQQQAPTIPGYPQLGPSTIGVYPFMTAPANAYPSYPTEGSFYSPQPMTPVTRQ